MPVDEGQAVDRAFLAYGSVSAIANLILAIQAETAEECARLASEVGDSYQFPSHHAVGAETVAVTIRRKYSLQAGDSEGRKDV